MSRWALVALVLAACHHDKSVKTTPNPPQTAAAPAAQQQPARQDAPLPVSTNVRAGADIVALCKLHATDEQQAAPKFAYDAAELTPQDRSVLQQIADCVTKGPLHGKRLQLIGRADPRGTEEYNMGLGDRRAHSVGTYLERLGVAAGVLDASTRGSLDATGHDEQSWQTDRRVDVELQN